MPKKLTGRERELEALAHRISEILRKEGIWVLPDSIVERKEGKISVSVTIFPKSWIQKHDDNLPIQTILRIGHVWKLYQIPESELESNPYAKREVKNNGR